MQTGTSVKKISVADPDPESGSLLIPGIRDGKKILIWDKGSQIIFLRA
jgi:hypothetical protein